MDRRTDGTEHCYISLQFSLMVIKKKSFFGKVNDLVYLLWPAVWQAVLGIASHSLCLREGCWWGPGPKSSLHPKPHHLGEPLACHLVYPEQNKHQLKDNGQNFRFLI